jgi:hypothetical protein
MLQHDGFIKLNGHPILQRISLLKKDDSKAALCYHLFFGVHHKKAKTMAFSFFRVILDPKCIRKSFCVSEKDFPMHKKF